MGYNMDRGSRVAAAISTRMIVRNTRGASSYHVFALLAGLGASLLAILSVAVFEGWLPTSLVDNFTSTELGVFSALLVAVAIVLYVMGERDR